MGTGSSSGSSGWATVGSIISGLKTAGTTAAIMDILANLPNNAYGIKKAGYSTDIIITTPGGSGLEATLETSTSKKGLLPPAGYTSQRIKKVVIYNNHTGLRIPVFRYP